MSRIEDEVCKKIQQRAEVGKNKYGVTMETAPLSALNGSSMHRRGHGLGRVLAEVD